MERLLKIGDVYRRIDKLTLQDYFLAGGNSIEHYNHITGKSVSLNDFKKDKLYFFGLQLIDKKKKLIIDKSMKKSDLIEAISKVVNAA